MSNLGLYQIMTSCAKKVGGPLNLAIVVAVGGYTVIRLGEASVKIVVKTIKNYSNERKNAQTEIYVVQSNGKANDELIFDIGDKYRVLEMDNDAVLIEKIGARNNPYWVSAELLRSVSNFDKKDENW